MAGMSYKKYAKDQWSLGLLLAGFLCLELSFGILTGIPGFYLWITGVGTTLVFFLISYLDYIRKKNFYRALEQGSKNLDKAYLLPELLEKPDFAEGQSVYETMLLWSAPWQNGFRNMRKTTGSIRNILSFGYMR